VRTLSRVVDRAALRALGRHVSPHQLRHSFATCCRAAPTYARSRPCSAIRISPPRSATPR
jgi:integrase